MNLDGSKQQNEVVEDSQVVEALDEIGNGAPRALGPMDKFVLAMDPSSLGSTTAIRQQKITEKLWKDRQHMLKHYITKWIYVHANILFHWSTVFSSLTLFYC